MRWRHSKLKRYVLTRTLYNWIDYLKRERVVTYRCKEILPAHANCAFNLTPIPYRSAELNCPLYSSYCSAGVCLAELCGPVQLSYWSSRMTQASFPSLALYCILAFQQSNGQTSSDPCRAANNQGFILLTLTY